MTLLHGLSLGIGTGFGLVIGAAIAFVCLGAIFACAVAIYLHLGGIEFVFAPTPNNRHRDTHKDQTTPVDDPAAHHSAATERHTKQAVAEVFAVEPAAAERPTSEQATAQLLTAQSATTGEAEEITAAVPQVSNTEPAPKRGRLVQTSWGGSYYSSWVEPEPTEIKLYLGLVAVIQDLRDGYLSITQLAKCFICTSQAEIAVLKQADISEAELKHETGLQLTCYAAAKAPGAPAEFTLDWLLPYLAAAKKEGRLISYHGLERWNGITFAQINAELLIPKGISPIDLPGGEDSSSIDMIPLYACVPSAVKDKTVEIRWREHQYRGKYADYQGIWGIATQPGFDIDGEGPDNDETNDDEPAVSQIGGSTFMRAENADILQAYLDSHPEATMQQGDTGDGEDAREPWQDSLPGDDDWRGKPHSSDDGDK